MTNINSNLTIKAIVAGQIETTRSNLGQRARCGDARCISDALFDRGSKPIRVNKTAVGIYRNDQACGVFNEF